MEAVPDLVRAVVGALIGLAALCGIGLLAHRRLTVAPGYGRTARRASILVLAIGLALFVAAAALLRQVPPEPVRPVIWAGMTVVALGLYLGLGLLVLALAALLLRLAGRRAARDRLLRVATPVVVVLAVVVTAYGTWEAERPRLTSYDVAAPTLPARYDGLRIALLTDLHVGPLHGAGWAQRAVDLVMAARPDLVVLGGDLVDGSPEDIGAYLEPLRGLHAPLGVVAVTGNHEMLGGEEEAAAWVERYESLGLDVLENESRVLGPGLVVAGVHDETGEGALAADPDAALAGVADDRFTIFVAHEPKQVEPGRGVDLQLSGHTHGGQLWPVGLTVPLADPVTAGVADVDGVRMVVSRGFGTSGPPVRVGAPPEVVLVVLRAGG